ncbi:hypothetical protein [Qipengyuania oceanensis]|uniref:Circumsporozoite protein n=1 Tax=Qipengyuania oceanensis TaxID=1463597 RepID=A0A844YJC8_9SPHN|nr:hypothetical protein [Qipengyuania oceanensis]MXO63972.1 hypothetical protein [Qipengyuania oceanensis]
MKKFVLPLAIVGLSLAACDQSETTVEGDTADMPAPTATETAVVTDTVEVPAEGAAADGSSVTVDGADVDATVTEEGVTATVDTAN